MFWLPNGVDRMSRLIDAITGAQAGLLAVAGILAGCAITQAAIGDTVVSAILSAIAVTTTALMVYVMLWSRRIRDKVASTVYELPRTECGREGCRQEPGSLYISVLIDNRTAHTLAAGSVFIHTHDPTPATHYAAIRALEIARDEMHHRLRQMN